MTEKTEFHSICPVISAKITKVCKHNSIHNLPNLPHGSSLEENKYVENCMQNTNAKEKLVPDKLKILFTDRCGHRSLSEQKVNDWLFQNRLFYECVPKDLTEIPDAIWAPPDGTKCRLMREEAEVNEPQDLTGNNIGTSLNVDYSSVYDGFPKFEKPVKVHGHNSKVKTQNQSPDTLHKASVTAINSNIELINNGQQTKPRRSSTISRPHRVIQTQIKQCKRHRSSTTRPNILTNGYQIPYFFQPPFKRLPINFESNNHFRIPLKPKQTTNEKCASKVQTTNTKHQTNTQSVEYVPISDRSVVP